MDAHAAVVWISVAMAMLSRGYHCYPGGAPDAACASMTPLHTSPPPQNTPTDPAPFNVTVSADSFEPGDVLTGRC